MPSLLSRFLGKKKNANPTPLLDGEKYEAIPKTPSPSAPTFSETAQRPISPSKAKSKEQAERGLGIPIRRKQAPSAVPAQSKVNDKLPMLSLSLPDPKLEDKKLQGLGVVFEGITDNPPRLDDEVLGAKRLSATETLILVQKTSEVICERALETLGVMRPHWFASSRQQEVQVQLISRFLQTLSTSQGNGTTTGSTSSPATFESELRYTRDPHDVAAVLRWGLRHLQLDGNSFGSSATVDWYQSFAESERSGSYPSKAFDDILVPLLPASHTQLLRSILDLVSSLAAHSEENGISGNKLSKVLGWWIVSSRDVQALGWREFYAQWEAAARQFEHLFLVYVRAQQAQSRMPKRLTELVKNYPFQKNRREDDGIFLPRSRFSTRSATALFVRVTSDKASASSHPHPLRIVEDGFQADAESEFTGEYAALWQSIRMIASKPTSSGDESKDKPTLGTEDSEASLNLSTILADETVRLLSLVPVPDAPSGPTLSLFTPRLARRSISVGDKSSTSSVANGNTQGSPKEAPQATGSPSASNRELEVATDWLAFSNAGFRSPSGLSLAASLWDNDTEVSQPVSKKGAGPGRRNLSVRSGSPRRASADSPLHLPSAPSARPSRLTYGVPQVVKLDEAFIDFWADTLLDTITWSWPTFVVCQLKAIPALRLQENGKPVEWLIIERVLAEPIRSSPIPVKTSAASARAASPTPASPTRSEGSKSRWTATTLAATRKRWSLFSHKHESAPVVQGGRDLAMRKAANGAKVGEMGEILREEDEGQHNGVVANGRTGVNDTKKVNGVKDQSMPKNEAEKKQDSPPVLSLDGISKPEAPPITDRKEAVVTSDATATNAEPKAVQGLTAVVEKPSDESEQAVEMIVQSTQPPATVATSSESQSITEPTLKQEPVAEPLTAQEEPLPAPDPVPTPEEPRASVVSVDIAKPPTSNDLVSHLAVGARGIPHTQSLEKQVYNMPVSKPEEEHQVSIIPIAEQADSALSAPVINQKRPLEEPSSAEYQVISTSDAPAEVESAPPVDEAPTPFEELQESTQPTTLEDAIVDQPLSSVPNVSSPSTEPDFPPPSKALVVESASEPQPASSGVTAATVEQLSSSGFDASSPSTEPDLPSSSETLVVEGSSETQPASGEVAAASVEEPAAVDLTPEQPEAVHSQILEGAHEESATTSTHVQTTHDVTADPEPEAEVVEPTTEKDVEEEGLDPSAPPGVQTGSDYTQESDILKTHDAEPAPIDEDESVNADPTVPSSLEPQSEMHTEDPSTINAEPAVGDEAGVIGEAASQAV